MNGRKSKKDDVVNVALSSEEVIKSGTSIKIVELLPHHVRADSQSLIPFLEIY
jgi:hypothetical protein